MNHEQLTGLAEAIESFTEHAEAVWTAYQSAGPGRVDAKLLDPIDSAISKLKELLQADGSSTKTIGQDQRQWRERVQTTVENIHQLSQRCITSREGLNFIAGEWGLIPQRDKIAAFEQGLASLKSLSKQSSLHCAPVVGCRQASRVAGASSVAD